MENWPLKKNDPVTYSVKGASLQLLKEKAILWDRMLLISDIHLGKISHFRKNGMALPPSASEDNYERLSTLLKRYRPERVVFLGDLFHSSYNQDWDRFGEFLSSFSDISFELVLGNHDILDKQDFVTVLDHVYTKSLIEPPFLLTHHPTTDREYYNLCGHIHPSFIVRGKGRQSLRLPCFHFSEHCGILPAFGTFTGTFNIRPETGDQIFLVANDELVKI